MDDRVCTADPFLQSFPIQQVPFDQPKPWMLQRILQKAALAGGEIVDSDDITVLFEKAVHHAAADEPGAPGYDWHARSPLNTKYFIRKNEDEAVVAVDAT